MRDHLILIQIFIRGVENVNVILNPTYNFDTLLSDQHR